MGMLEGLRRIMLRADDEGMAARADRWFEGAPVEPVDAVCEAHRMRRERAERVVAGALSARITAVESLEDWELILPRVHDVARDAGIDEHLTGDATAAARRRVIETEYRRMVRDDRYSDAALLTVQDAIGAAEGFAEAMVLPVAVRIIEEVLVKLLADGKVTPEEDAELAETLRRVGADDIEFAGEAGAALAAARARYLAESGPMPIIAPPINLQRGEICHWHRPAEASEVRARTVGVSYAGPRARIRIMRGLSYTIGSTALRKHTEEYRHSHGRGTLVLTSKRLVWIGPNRSWTAPFAGIVDFESFSDGIKVFKTSGKPMLFVYSADPLMPLLAARAITLGGAPID